jgi:adiponectin receptor
MTRKDSGNFRHRGSLALQNMAALDQLSEDLPFLNGQRKKLSEDGDNRRLLTWEEIEPWQQNNCFIIRGYRQATNSYLKSIASLTYIHNQTVNIYTHLLGAIIFMVSSYVLYQAIASRYSTATWTDLVVFGCFFLGLFLCLFWSACFHTFGNHSDVVYRSGLLMDLIGIVCLINGSFFPGVYYGFYCEPGPTYAYWAMVRGLPPCPSPSLTRCRSRFLELEPS